MKIDEDRRSLSPLCLTCVGIKLDANLSPTTHLYNVNRKLSDYLKRNEWLLKAYFTPKSLIQLANYYQTSRLTYGLSNFLDAGNIMESLEKARLKYFRSILGTKDNIKSNLLRVVFNLPKMEYALYPRLLRTVEKYYQHFGERPTMFDHIIEAFDRRLGPLRNNYDDRVKQIRDINVSQMAAAEGIQIGCRFNEMIDKVLYKYPDRRDNFLVSYMLSYGFFDSRLFPKCKLCGSDENSKLHVTNDCPHFDQLRKKTLKQVGNLIGVSNLDDLGYWLEVIYYSPYIGWTEKQIRKLLEVMKKFTVSLYMERPRK